MMLKKMTAALLAAATMLSVGLVSCGDSSSSSGSSTSDSQSAGEAKDVSAVADELKNGIEFKDSLNEIDPAVSEAL